MKLRATTSSLRLKSGVGLLSLTLAQGLAAEGSNVQSESKLENPDTKVTAPAVSAGDENLSKELSLARESVKTLTASLAAAREETDLYRRRYTDLEERAEALGMESLGGDQTKLEQRLLNAVSDLRLMGKALDKERDQMLGLSEAVLHLLKTSTGGDAVARMEVEAQLRATRELTSPSQNAQEAATTLLEARVVSVKEEWSLVVGNIGEKQGVRMGMPLRVTRGDKLIAMLRVVDVRQRICGAVIQDANAGKIRVGDRLQADLRENVSLK